ncbi:MAG: response regulator [Verrucomicrobiae bacterium]|nr:response regulator [Verrucomicrobiae bacterium]
MKTLIADDDNTSRFLLVCAMRKLNHETVEASNGAAAWEEIQKPDAPDLCVVDWMMPGIDGLELCRRMRAHPGLKNKYIILLTSRDKKDDIVTGLEAGSDDYLTKPFDQKELCARVKAGERILNLQKELADKVGELEKALGQVKQLKGLIPICAYCKKIRTDNDYWQQVDTYVAQHSDATFSHGICPDCYAKALKEVKAAAARRRNGSP